MRQRRRVALSVLLWLLASGAAVAATPPTKIVQQFIEAHLQGRFAAARGFAVEQVTLDTSLFSDWLFGAAGHGGEVGTADIFLSRKFSEAFHFTIIETTPHGDKQVTVTAVRSTPNLVHLYTWALAPHQGATPYALIEAIDAYLTRVNFPIEESRMEFTLIRETSEWYIRAVYDEKFVQFRQQWLPALPLSVALPFSGSGLAAPGVPAGPAPEGTTTTDNVKRQVADSQFHATRQSFNLPYQPPTTGNSPPAQAEEEPPFLGKIFRAFGLGGEAGAKRDDLLDKSLRDVFNNIRDALVLYAASNNDLFPDQMQIYDWKSFRQVVNRYNKKSLPETEEEASFSFVDYRPVDGNQDYALLVEPHQPQKDVKRFVVTPYSVEPAQ